MLAALRARGIELRLDGEELRFRAPPGSLPPEERAQLAEQRTALTALLRAESAEQAEAVALLVGLRASDIHLRLDADKLRLNAPKGAVDDALRAEIGARRDALIALLRAEAQKRDAGTAAGTPAAPAGPAGIRRHDRRAPLPISSVQRRLWFLDRLNPGQSSYNIGGAIRIAAGLDEAMLRQAIEQLQARHEALRMRIGERDGQPWLEIMERSAATVEVLDMADLPDPERAATAAAQRLLGRPLDMASGRLAGFLAIHLGPQAHILAFSLHHIIADGWSLVLAMAELGEIYAALRGGRAPRLAPLPIGYVDYAAWEGEQLATRRLDRHVAYWKQALHGAPALLELPTDRPRSARAAYRGTRLNRSFDRTLVEAVQRLGQARSTTQFMTLLAAWQVLLHRYSGQEEIVVGTPIANRDLAAFEGLVGCFVNNIPLRARLGDNPSFAAFLDQTKRVQLEAFDHRALPFDLLVEALNPDRTTGHAPIFQTLFTFMAFPPTVRTDDLPHSDLLPLDPGNARFDLTVEIGIATAGMRVGDLGVLYEYDTDLFDASTIARLHNHYVEILRAVTAAPESRIGDLPLLGADEALALAAARDRGALAHDRTRCVHHLLEAAARARPAAVAVVAGGATLDYRTLDARANRLAHLLRGHGVGPGSLVAICLDRDAELPVALAGVLKAGGAYVPLDPAHPPARLRETVADAGVACVLTLARHAPLFATAEAGAAAPAPPLLLIDEAAAALAAQPDGAPDVAVAPEDLAYVIYTSGSTGRPKGVEVEHRNLVAFLEAMRHEPGITATDTLLAVTTPAFDIAGLEIWLPLSVGARVVIARREAVVDGVALSGLMERHGVTLLQATPATWRLLIDSGWAGRSGLRALCGGEALPRDLAAALLERVDALWNMYGPTETTVWSTTARIRDASGPPSIGRAIANTRTYVLDAAGREVPPGVVGELCIGGEGVARGYRGLPALTAERFVALALPGGPAEGGERVYRTGDLARRRADGTLDYLGRADQQVKIRGYRIELGEIEARLAVLPGVSAAVVAAHDVAPGDRRLTGYVVLRPAATFDAGAARDALRTALPDYMVPASFSVLDALPLTPNGKVDRKALPAPRRDVAAPPRAEVLMTPPQRRVAAMWRDLLQVDRVGLHDNFFDVGGHSLLLVRLHAGLQQEFGVVLPVVELFERSTVAAQAELLAGAERLAPSAVAMGRA